LGILTALFFNEKLIEIIVFVALGNLLALLLALVSRGFVRLANVPMFEAPTLSAPHCA
jgi:hypothetical protein